MEQKIYNQIQEVLEKNVNVEIVFDSSLNVTSYNEMEEEYEEVKISKIVFDGDDILVQEEDSYNWYSLEYLDLPSLEKVLEILSIFKNL